MARSRNGALRSVSSRIPPDVYEQLAAAAGEADTDVSSFLRSLILSSLKKRTERSETAAELAQLREQVQNLEESHLALGKGFRNVCQIILSELSSGTIPPEELRSTIDAVFPLPVSSLNRMQGRGHA